MRTGRTQFESYCLKHGMKAPMTVCRRGGVTRPPALTKLDAQEAQVKFDALRKQSLALGYRSNYKLVAPKVTSVWSAWDDQPRVHLWSR